MRSFVLFFVLLLLVFRIATPARAFPPAIAKKILGRPVGGDLMDRDMGQIFDAIIEGGGDEVRLASYNVGNPSVNLSVLMVEPRNYGLKISDEFKVKKNSLSYSCGISCINPLLPKRIEEKLKAVKSRVSTVSIEFTLEEVAVVDNPEAQKPIEEEKKHPKPDAGGGNEVSFNFTLDEVALALKHQARVGSGKKSTDNPRTVFLLHGYGVSKKVGLPLALLLADHGIRTILVDLRGQGDSGGRGITWGKREPGDLAQLLSILQKQGIVEKERAVGVIGISYGAAMAAVWSAQDSRVKHSVLIAPYKQADRSIIAAVDQFKDSIKFPFELKEKGVVKGTEIAAKRLNISWQDVSPAQAIPKIGNPVLLATSTEDKIIPRKEVAELFGKAPSGSKLHVFKEIPHEWLGANFNATETLVVDWFKETGFLSE